METDNRKVWAIRAGDDRDIIYSLDEPRPEFDDSLAVTRRYWLISINSDAERYLRAQAREEQQTQPGE